jgi:hypothetical protein
MSVFYIGSYDIVDPSEFQKYPPVVHEKHQHGAC